MPFQILFYPSATIQNLPTTDDSIENEKGLTKGINSANFHALKRALERKSDYLKLLKDRDMIIKHAENKEREMDELSPTKYDTILITSG